MSSIEEIILLIDKLIQRYKGHSLSSLQKSVLQASLNQPRKNYAQIAHENNYSETYIKHLVAPELWKLLSEILGEKINRTNCTKQLNNLVEKLSYIESKTLDVASSSLTVEKIEADSPAITQNKFILQEPKGQVPLDSPLYVNRGSLEKNCYEKILEPNAFICINAPRNMGKTSLMARILQYSAAQSYHTVRLSLNQVESQLLKSTTKFIRWLYTNIIYQLHLKSELNHYNHEDLGTLVSCTVALEESVLKKLDHPLVLAIDEVDQLLILSSLSRDFFCLLRHWYQKSKDNKIWQKLRLVIVCSTDIYASLNSNYFPFKLGSTIELPTFNQQEITNLIQNHQIQTTELEIKKLSELTGGLPYLVRLALYQSTQQNLSLDKILSDATHDTGIYAKHLQEKLWQLRQNHCLFQAFLKLITNVEPVNLNPEIQFKLKSLGLVHLKDNQTRVSCELYQKYFQNSLFCR
ncbi:MAG: AAA-like domain-containing protein [Xenococcus sp. (in: cyanobacteria)]